MRREVNLVADQSAQDGVSSQSLVEATFLAVETSEGIVSSKASR